MNKKSSAEDQLKIFLYGNFYEDFEFFSKIFFVQPKIFLLVANVFADTNIFFLEKKTVNGSKCLQS